MWIIFPSCTTTHHGAAATTTKTSDDKWRWQQWLFQLLFSRGSVSQSIPNLVVGSGWVSLMMSWKTSTLLLNSGVASHHENDEWMFVEKEAEIASRKDDVSFVRKTEGERWRRRRVWGDKRLDDPLRNIIVSSLFDFECIKLIINSWFTYRFGFKISLIPQRCQSRFFSSNHHHHLDFLENARRQSFWNLKSPIKNVYSQDSSKFIKKRNPRLRFVSDIT